MIKKILLYLMALLYVAAGINHFWHPENYILIMPAYFPAKSFLNLAAGVAEIILGVMLMFSKTRRLAAYGIIILLILFIPIHIYMIQMNGCMGPTLCIPLWLAWVRLFPLQFLLIAWAWWVRRS